MTKKKYIPVPPYVKLTGQDIRVDVYGGRTISVKLGRPDWKKYDE